MRLDAEGVEIPHYQTNYAYTIPNAGSIGTDTFYFTRCYVSTIDYSGVERFCSQGLEQHCSVVAVGR